MRSFDSPKINELKSSAGDLRIPTFLISDWRELQTYLPGGGGFAQFIYSYVCLALVF